MAKATDVITVPDDDKGAYCPRPKNPISAEEYAEGLDNIILQFKESVLEDCKDVLLSMVNSMKRCITTQFEQMCLADVEVVMRTIKDMRCLTLRQNMEVDQVTETDPDDDIPSGREVILKLVQEKKLSQAVIDNIISLFDHLSEAHAHMSMAVADLSSLGKITDPVTFKMILRASI